MIPLNSSTIGSFARQTDPTPPWPAKFTNTCGEAFDWYLEAVPDIYYAESSIAEIPDGVEQYITPYFVPLPDGYDFTKEAFPCYPSSVSCYPDQKFIFEANWDMVVGTGLMDARFGHFAEKLEKDGDRVSTVYARNAETGKYVKATASKGVILATGEYSSNPEFLKFFCPATVENEIRSCGGPTWTSKQARQPGRRPSSWATRVAPPCSSTMPDDSTGWAAPTAARAWTCPRSAPRRFYT